MKVCPQCNKQYEDESLNFCLDDGSVLNRSEDVSSTAAPTVFMDKPPSTALNTPAETQQQRDTVETPARYEPHTKSGSKSWLWVLGILGAIILMCGGGLVGLGLIGAFVEEDEPEIVAKPDRPMKPSAKDDRRLRRTLNLARWYVSENDYIRAESEGKELILRSKPRYFYVILSKDLRTYDASVKLTVRNKEGLRSNLGYGLVVHSNPLEVLDKDYAFLIRTEKQEFRIARHSGKKESNVVGWTSFPSIKKGKQPNVLEVRANGKDMNFYINGVFVRTEKDFSNYKSGVAGVYTSGDEPIGFSEMEYRK